MTEETRKELAKRERIINDYDNPKNKVEFGDFLQALIDFRLWKQAEGINIYRGRIA